MTDPGDTPNRPLPFDPGAWEKRLQDSTLSAAERNVLRQLALPVNTRGYAYISIEKLAYQLEMSDRYVSMVIKDMVTARVLRLVPFREHRIPTKTKVYHLDPWQIPQWEDQLIALCAAGKSYADIALETGAWKLGATAPLKDKDQRLRARLRKLELYPAGLDPSSGVDPDHSSGVDPDHSSGVDPDHSSGVDPDPELGSEKPRSQFLATPICDPKTPDPRSPNAGQTSTDVGQRSDQHLSEVSLRSSPAGGGMPSPRPPSASAQSNRAGQAWSDVAALRSVLGAAADRERSGTCRLWSSQLAIAVVDDAGPVERELLKRELRDSNQWLVNAWYLAYKRTDQSWAVVIRDEDTKHRALLWVQELRSRFSRHQVPADVRRNWIVQGWAAAVGVLDLADRPVPEPPPPRPAPRPDTPAFDPLAAWAREVLASGTDPDAMEIASDMLERAEQGSFG